MAGRCAGRGFEAPCSYTRPGTLTRTVDHVKPSVEFVGRTAVCPTVIRRGSP